MPLSFLWPLVRASNLSHPYLNSASASTPLFTCQAEEIMAPYRVWQKHGYSITIASIKGGEVPMDETSLAPPFLNKEVRAQRVRGKRQRTSRTVAARVAPGGGTIAARATCAYG